MSHSTKRLRVLLYRRMSTDEQTLSIPQQDRWADAVSMARNLEIVARFADPGISGNDPNRPDFLRMIGEAERQAEQGTPIDGVLCWDASRFSRMGLPKTMKFVDRLLEAGVARMLTAEKDIDFTKDADLIVFAVEQQAGRHAYVKNASASSLRGLLDNYESGGQNGGSTPYAFMRALLNEKGEVKDTIKRGQKVAKPQGWKTVRVPDLESFEAQVVVDLFRRYDLEDISTRHLASDLNARGIPSPRGGLWDGKTVRALLKNPIYAGGYRWGLLGRGEHNRVVKGKATPQGPGGKRTRKGKRKVEINEDVPIRWGEITPLVDRERWERVQRKLKEQSQDNRKPRAEGCVLTGLLFCGHCRKKMFGEMVKASRPKKGVRPRQYRCYICNTAKRSGKAACRRYRIREDQVLALLLKRLREEYLSPERLAGLRTALLERIRARQQADPARVSWLRERVDELDRELKKGRAKLFTEEDPVIYGELKTAQQEKLDLKERYQGELATLERQAGVPLQDQEQQVEAALARLRDLEKQLQTAASPTKLREVLRLLVSRIDLYFTLPPNPKPGRRYPFRNGVIKLRPLLVRGGNGESSCEDLPLPSEIHFTAADLSAA